MALTTLAEYYTWRGLSASSQDAMYQLLIDEVNDAIVQYCNNGTIELSSYTLIVPAQPRVVMFTPHFPIVASTLNVYVNLNANNISANFTSDDLLTYGTDYVLDLGPNNATHSYSGKITFQNGAPGAGYMVRPYYTLSLRLQSNPGSMKLVYDAGWSPVPASLMAAAFLMVSKLYAMRRYGQIATNESWNGYSIGWQSPLSLIQGDATIRNMLRPFTRGITIGAYDGGP